MKLYILFIVLLALSAIIIAGCAPAQEKEPASEPYQPPVLREQAPLPEQPDTAPADAGTEVEQIEDISEVKEEKQLELGTEDMKEEDLTLLGAINCTFSEEDDKKSPLGFSFKMSNIEEKDWILGPLSYSERSQYENPIVTVNALQVTNDQLVLACGRSRFKPGKTANCVFDLEDPRNTILRKSLRIGETAVGNSQVNTINLRTTKHTGEIKFYCE